MPTLVLIRPLISAAPAARPSLRRTPALLCIPTTLALCVAGACLQMFIAEASHAQVRLALKLQTELIEKRTDDGSKLPAFMQADKISGSSDADTILSGNAQIRKAGATIKADTIIYNGPNDEARALGNVRAIKETLLMTGPELRMKVGSYEGYFLQPSYFIKNLGGHGNADRADFDGVEHVLFQNPNYTTCPVPGAQDADWYLKAKQINIDTGDETGEAQSARVYFKGIPILAAPTLSFPLNDKRKSGFLPPSFGVTSRSGAELLVPYYFDIAPNKDVVLNPRIVSKRGFQYGAQGRYLEANSFGEIKFERIERDNQTNTPRYSFLLNNTYNNNRGWNGGLNVNKVSDDQYFVDFSRSLAAASQRSLPRDGFATYAKPNYSLTARITRYQTLQDVSAPVVDPYDRLPQLTLNSQRLDIGGADVFLMAEAGGFAHRTLVDGQRIVLRPSITYPILTPALSITPRLTLQSVSYNLNRIDAGQNPRQTSSIPIASLNAKVTFERPTQFLGKAFLQTLEPRLYYLYAPYREQNSQPLFDTGLSDFNFAQIFSENRFSGYDRVGDANQLTAAVVSRLIDEKTGVERLRFALGQRFNFTPPKLVLAGQSATNPDLSDFLAAVSGQVRDSLTVDAALQIDAETKRLARSNFGLRYKPTFGRLLNLNYRYTRNALDQFDISAQWPLADKISGVGRFNYSVSERRIIESLAGIEYNAGCWAVRGLTQQFATSTGTSTTSLFVQLQLIGFGNIGSNPLELLRRNVPGYSPATLPTGSTSKFTDYE